MFLRFVLPYFCKVDHSGFLFRMVGIWKKAMGLGFLGFWVLGDHFSHRERFFSAKSDPFTASRKIVANAQKQLLRRSFTVLCVFVFSDFWPSFGPKSTRTCPYRWRPYRNEYTGSLQNSEVNRCRARIVLRWGTAREVLRVLPALFGFSRGLSSCFCIFMRIVARNVIAFLYFHAWYRAC